MRPTLVIALLVLLAGSPPLGSPALAGDDYTRNVAIVIWDGAEILDWAGPTEVFESASRFGRDGDTPAFRIYTVSRDTEPITTQRVVRVVPEYSITDAPPPDILVLPGGGTGTILGDPEFLAWASEAAKDAEVSLSVCTGAFVLGEVGQLDGRQVTTWFGATDRLEEKLPTSTVIRGKRFVDSGDVITTAGVSAGIDGSLHLVARLLGREVADQTARYMEYRWTPEPYLARDYSVLNPSLDERGRRIQSADLEAGAGRWDSAAETYRAVLEESPEDAGVWMKLGEALYATEQWSGAAEAYDKAADSEALRLRASYNAACSLARAGETERALDHLAAAIDAGLDSVDYVRADEDLASLRAEPRFEQLLASVD